MRKEDAKHRKKFKQQLPRMKTKVINPGGNKILLTLKKQHGK